MGREKEEERDKESLSERDKKRAGEIKTR